MKTITLGNKVHRILLPKIQSMLTGVVWIDRTHDLVVLKYSDGTTEAGNIDRQSWTEIKDDTFRIVSTVQSQRK